MRTKEQLSESLERMQKGEFYDKSPERIGNHAAASLDPAVTTSQNKVVVTSVSVE